MMMSASKATGAMAEEVEEEREEKGDKTAPGAKSPVRQRTKPVNGSQHPVKTTEDIGIDNSGIVGEAHSHLPHTTGKPCNSPALLFLEQAKKVWKFTDKDSKLTQGN